MVWRVGMSGWLSDLAAFVAVRERWMECQAEVRQGVVDDVVFVERRMQ